MAPEKTACNHFLPSATQSWLARERRERRILGLRDANWQAPGFPGRLDILRTSMGVGVLRMVSARRKRRGVRRLIEGRRSLRIRLSLYHSVWRREEFGDLLRSGFSHAALPRRTTKIVMWTCTTGLRRSSRRHGGTHSPCWWHEDAPKWVFTRPKRTGLGAFWTLITWTTTTRRLTTSKPPVQW